jgi:hypothetical protein
MNTSKEIVLIQYSRNCLFLILVHKYILDLSTAASGRITRLCLEQMLVVGVTLKGWAY